MRKAAPAPFTASPELLALRPEISGNTLNGLGEAEARPPTPIYWHAPERIPHGRLQQFMLEKTRLVHPSEVRK